MLEHRLTSHHKAEHAAQGIHKAETYKMDNPPSCGEKAPVFVHFLPSHNRLLLTKIPLKTMVGVCTIPVNGYNFANSRIPELLDQRPASWKHETVSFFGRFHEPKLSGTQEANPISATVSLADVLILIGLTAP